MNWLVYDEKILAISILFQHFAYNSKHTFTPLLYTRLKCHSKAVRLLTAYLSTLLAIPASLITYLFFCLRLTAVYEYDIGECHMADRRFYGSVDLPKWRSNSDGFPGSVCRSGCMGWQTPRTEYKWLSWWRSAGSCKERAIVWNDEHKAWLCSYNLDERLRGAGFA